MKPPKPKKVGKKVKAKEAPSAFLIHVGKKCPKGTVEVPGSVHLGGGIWILKCQISQKEIPIKNQLPTKERK